MNKLLLAINWLDIWNKFWHFFIVGGGGFAIDTAITYFFLKIIKAPKYLSNSLGFMAGVTFNYFLNRIWTFKSDDPNVMMQYIKFAVIGIIGLIIVNSVLYLLHSKYKQPFFFSKVMAMIVFMFWNFGANYFYTFGG